MIVFDLLCSQRHQFEGWFRSSEEFARQEASGMLTCPQCDCKVVSKAPMAPAVPAKLNRTVPKQEGKVAPEAARSSGKAHAPTMPAELAAAFAKLAAAQAKVLGSSRWVGDDFAERTRAIHYGEADEERIHGRASAEEAAALVEEGIGIVPLLVPVVPPDEAN